MFYCLKHSWCSKEAPCPLCHPAIITTGLTQSHKTFAGPEAGESIKSELQASQDRGWEVVAVHQGQGSYTTLDKNGKVRYAHFAECSLEDALQNRGYKIYSVLRKSDNTTWTVGEEVAYNERMTLSISKFYITDQNCMYAHFAPSGDHDVSIYSLKKLNSQSPPTESKQEERIQVGMNNEVFDVVRLNERLSQLQEIENAERNAFWAARRFEKDSDLYNNHLPNMKYRTFEDYKKALNDKP